MLNCIQPKTPPFPLDNFGQSPCLPSHVFWEQIPSPPCRSSDIDGELFKILIICNVGVYRLADDFGAFLAVLLDPFGVFIFGALGLFLLVPIYISLRPGSKMDEQMLMSGRYRAYMLAGFEVTAIHCVVMEPRLRWNSKSARLYQIER